MDDDHGEVGAVMATMAWLTHRQSGTRNRNGTQENSMQHGSWCNWPRRMWWCHWFCGGTTGSGGVGHFCGAGEGDAVVLDD